MSQKTKEGTKKCLKCEVEKPKAEFYAVGGKCKECVKAMQRERNKKDKEKKEKINKDPELSKATKVCRECQEEKPITAFRINRGECHDCEKAFGRKYNKEHYDVRQKWQDENKEHFDQLRADWYQKNKPKVREKYNDRYENDIEFRVHRLLSRRLQVSIRKIRSTEDYTGMKYGDVARWLEYNFTEEMTWDNHGTVWDIDHVIPVCKWNLKDSSQVDMCFNWKNLSPCPSAVNRNEERDKLDPKQITRHMKNLRKYFEEKEMDEEELQSYLEKYEEKINEVNGKKVKPSKAPQLKGEEDDE